MLRIFTTLIIIGIAQLAMAQPRIITAGSALTETICALGDSDKIVATDRTSLYPADMQKLPSIGYRSSISAEGIISQKPTILIAEKDYVESAVLTQVQTTGIKVIIIDRQYSLDGTKSMIRQLADAINRKQEGEKLIKKIETDLAEANAIIKKSKSTPRVLCVYNRDKSSFSVAGANTFSGILPYAGAQPAITGVEGYKPLNTEALMAANPDYLLMFEAGVQALGGIDGVLSIPGIAQTTAGKKKQVVTMEGIKVSNFGPRMGEAAKELAIKFHPDVQP